MKTVYPKKPKESFIKWRAYISSLLITPKKPKKNGAK